MINVRVSEPVTTIVAQIDKPNYMWVEWKSSTPDYVKITGDGWDAVSQYLPFEELKNSLSQIDKEISNLD